MRIILCALLIALSPLVQAQKKAPSEKALLYRISGNGLTKPSYLYGTMHVSNKLAFYLNDTFFMALKSADVVGLETDPGKWFEQMLVSQYYSPLSLFDGTQDKLTGIDQDIFNLSVSNRVLTRAMAGTPRIVNGFLYRHQDNSGNSEEDTYLDLYIYQAACKLGKEVHSVEDFEESERLVKEAREAVAKSKRTYLRHRSALVGENTLENAYRNGDIDMIDSLDNLMRYPKEYYENMLYTRNANMVRYMDSLMKTKSMFVGVGVSHLPGQKGMLNMLKEKGYTITPVAKINKNSPQKEAIDNMNMPVTMQPYTTPDNLLSFKVPGKVYAYPKDDYSQKYLCQDMGNGSYYLVTRVKTYASLFGQDMNYSFERIDSLLYENIPGKISSKKAVTINGFKGYDIANKTSQGKFQRHLIVVLPDEVIFFRLHGSENYLKQHGNTFIGSVSINLPQHAYALTGAETFHVEFPLTPASFTEQSQIDHVAPVSREWIASGKPGTFYATELIVNNTSYIEEDSFDLELMAHNFSDELKGEMLEKTHTGNSTLHFQTLIAKKDTGYGRLYIRNNRVYLLYALGPDPGTRERFFQSFRTSQVSYTGKSPYTDTTLQFKVTTYAKPYDPDKFNRLKRSDEDSTKAYSVSRWFIDTRTGEEVRLHYYRYNKYENEYDSAQYWKWRMESLNRYNDYITTVIGRSGDKENAMIDFIVSDTGSSRGIRYKIFIRGDAAYRLSAATDNKGQASEFVSSVFESFEPVNDFKRPSLFSSRVALFTRDLVSSDSTTRAQAVSAFDLVTLDADTPARIMQAIDDLQQDEKYEDTKVRLIKKLGSYKDPRMFPWLERTYIQAEDTLKFKLAVLYTLSRIPSKASYNLWVKLVTDNMPEASEDSEVSQMLYGFGIKDTNEHIRLITPTLLKLLYTQDYKGETYNLLARLKDKKLIKHTLYKSYIDMIVVDAKREMKAQRDKEKRSWSLNQVNVKLQSINKLLIPYYTKNKQVQAHFAKVLQTRSDELKMNTIALMAQNNVPVSDTMVFNLAAKLSTRQAFYEKLNYVKRTSIFPDTFNTAQQRLDGLIYSLISQNNRESKDTFAVFMTSTIVINQKSYTIHSFKFRNPDDMVWQTGIVGTCGNDSCLNKLNRQVSTITKKYYNEDLHTERFVSDEIRTLWARRRGYNNYSYNNYMYNEDLYDYYDYED